MNLRYQNVSQKIRRIRAELEETLRDINEALRIDHKHGAKLDKARTRIKTACLHLEDIE